MSGTRNKQTVLRNCKVILTKTNIIDTVHREFSAPFTRETYHPLHVGWSGQGICRFDEGQPSEVISPGDVWPKADTQYNTLNYDCEALLPNSSFYCVIPTKFNYLDEQTTEMAAGESLDVPLKVIAFLFGTEFEVNGVRYTENTVFATEDNTAEIMAIQPLKAVLVYSADYDAVEILT